MFNVLEIFGHWLRERREIRRLSQEQAAQLAGISRVSWSKIERGKARPRKANVQRIVKAVHSSLGQALEMLDYPAKDIKLAYRSEKTNNARLNKAVLEFREILHHPESRAEAILCMTHIYDTYYKYQKTSDVNTALDPFAYQRAILSAVELNPLHQWFLAREIILYLWRSRLIPCFPEIEEFREFNREQTRVLRIVAQSLKEKRIDARLRDHSKIDEYRREHRHKQK